MIKKWTKQEIEDLIPILETEGIVTRENNSSLDSRIKQVVASAPPAAHIAPQCGSGMPENSGFAAIEFCDLLILTWHHFLPTVARFGIAAGKTLTK